MPTSDITPTVAEVGAWLPTRTVDARNNQLGTFTTTTRPTAETVTGLISEAVDEIAGLVGPDLPDGPNPSDPDSIRRMGKRAVALSAALAVELTQFPEQIGTNRSAYPQLKVRYDELFSQLEAAIEAVGGRVPDPDEPTGAVIGTGGFPSYDFPEDAGGMINWGTPF